MKKPKPTFAERLSRYPVYDRAAGAGSASEWRAAFEHRMGREEARTVLAGEGPAGVLGVSASASADEIRSAYRKLAMRWHPDRAGITGVDPVIAEREFKRISAAYSLLQKEG